MLNPLTLATSGLLQANGVDLDQINAILSNSINMTGSPLEYVAPTVHTNEGDPAAYAPAPTGLSVNAAALDKDFIWQRIEAYTAYRFGSRPVEFYVCGPGVWGEPLCPFTFATAHIWDAVNEEWVGLTPSGGPMGGKVLPQPGMYKITGTVGEDTYPADIGEAFRRYAEYVAEGQKHIGPNSTEATDISAVTVSHTRSVNWMSRAMQHSGAGDLLRRYRRLE
ncbi:hypothetical protein SAMN05444000_12653 [Shimia gijangensis]|uniref:Uncharacterized protein n=1 Tax=Shimia gijangensis TaxID=1470563 RepID=A0A1M6RV10_9RHOB|nr:hypothetical protein [Shimia gijangensis]SHK36264.1 hypothetical protein SAMN05444000_12653 [Shimia gijangensis]